MSDKARCCVCGRKEAKAEMHQVGGNEQKDGRRGLFNDCYVCGGCADRIKAGAKNAFYARVELLPTEAKALAADLAAEAEKAVARNGLRHSDELCRVTLTLGADFGKQARVDIFDPRHGNNTAYGGL